MAVGPGRPGACLGPCHTAPVPGSSPRQDTDRVRVGREDGWPVGHRPRLGRGLQARTHWVGRGPGGRLRCGHCLLPCQHRDVHILDKVEAAVKSLTFALAPEAASNVPAHVPVPMACWWSARTLKAGMAGALPPAPSHRVHQSPAPQATCGPSVRPEVGLGALTARPAQPAPARSGWPP